jgi:hypothetical protein
MGFKYLTLFFSAVAAVVWVAGRATTPREKKKLTLLAVAPSV